MRTFVFLIAAYWLGCAHSGSDERSNEGRGTEACRIWQDAACDHFADSCDAIARDTCDRQYQSVTCRSDALAKKCSDQLESADCGEATVDCLIDSVADAQPATEACEMLIDRFCERTSSCGKAEMDACLTSSYVLISCAKAVGYRVDFDRCLAQVSELSCDDLALPAICRDAILLRE